MSTSNSATMVLVSQSPAEIIERFAPRPVGGGHRAEGEAVTKSFFWRRSRGGARADESAYSGRLLDAFDAANTLGAHCFMWHPESMLEHPELAQLGFDDAADRIRREIRSLGWRAWTTTSGRARYVELTEQLDELRQCADIIVSAHAQNLIAGNWIPLDLDAA